MTLNQKYKASGSNLSFKDWIETQKSLGLVSTDKVQTNESENENFAVDYKGISFKQVAIGLTILTAIGVGIWAYKKYNKK
jgi:hypothetical protein